MWGIAGFADIDLRQGSVPADRSRLKAMCDVMRHRGPDDEGFYVEPGVALGMRRLSIIDLAGGHQPIHNEERTVWVVFNGEIYNYRELRDALEAAGHRFYTSSDTETIAHGYEEWGEHVFARLRKLNLASTRVSDARRATLYGAVAVATLTLTATSRLWQTGTGEIVWFALLGGSAYAAFAVVWSARKY